MVKSLIAKETNKTVSLALYSLAVFGFSLNTYIYYPGFISPDTLDQYTQAITHNYNDWHPPIMAGFWSILLAFKSGSASMFFLQIGFYWLSFLIIGQIFIKYSAKCLLITSFFFFAPFMQNFVGNIWKDVGLAVSWLFSLSLIVKALLEKRKLSVLESTVTFLFLCYGAWIRINALPGVIPLIGLWLYAFSYQENQAFHFRKIALKTFLLTILIVIIQILITDFVLKPKKLYPEYKLLLHDLSGIYKETGKLYYPDFLTSYPAFDTVYIKDNYIHSTFDNIWWNPKKELIVPSADAEQMAQLRKAWAYAIFKHPHIYVKNKAYGVLDFLRITNSGSRLIITFNYTETNNFGLVFKSKKLTDNIRFLIESQRSMPYMKPWFWFLTSILTLIYAYRKLMGTIKIIVLSLVYSSLLYFGLQFVVFQTDAEFRYFYWNCTSISLSLILILVDNFLLKNEPINTLHGRRESDSY